MFIFPSLQAYPSSIWPCNVGKSSKIGHILILYHKEKLKQIKNLNIRAKTIKFLEENREQKLQDAKFGSVFLDMTKAQATKVGLH